MSTNSEKLAPRLRAFSPMPRLSKHVIPNLNKDEMMVISHAINPSNYEYILNNRDKHILNYIVKNQNVMLFCKILTV